MPNIIKTACVTVVLALALPIAVFGEAGPFPDVPADHWAADAVKQMKDSGIIKGYPDETFQGEKIVTRYELAVALERMVLFIEQSRKPLVEAPKPAAEDKTAVMPVETQPLWAKPSLDFLVEGGFLPEDSALLKDGQKVVTPDLLGESLTSVAVRLAAIEADGRKQEDNAQDDHSIQ